MDPIPLRIAVFASGSGTNLEAILQSIERGELKASVVTVISNKPGAGALERAARRNIPTHVLSPNDFPDEAEYVKNALDIFRSHDVNFVALAGYLKKIPAALVEAYRHRMLNIHPALLPAFGGPGMYGKRIHEAVLKFGARWSGATVHLVDENYDTGPIVLQKPVPVYQEDTPATLAERILAVEHRLYPEALRLFSEGRVQIQDRTVRIDPMIPGSDSPSTKK